MYNSVTLVGNLGKAPESRTFDNGSSVCRFSLATSRSWKSAQGEKQEDTQWHNVVLWNKLGEIAQQYLDKGSKVLISGRITYRESEGKYYTDIVANEMKMLDNRNRDNRFPDEPRTNAVVQNSIAAQTPAPVAEKDLPF